MTHSRADAEAYWERLDRLGGCWPYHLLEEPRGVSAAILHNPGKWPSPLEIPEEEDPVKELAGPGLVLVQHGGPKGWIGGAETGVYDRMEQVIPRLAPRLSTFVHYAPLAAEAHRFPDPLGALRRVVRARWLRLTAYLRWSSEPPSPRRHRPDRPHPLPRRSFQSFESVFGWF